MIRQEQPIRIRIQDVWVDRPQLWLNHVELTLNRAGIHDDTERFYAVIQEFNKDLFERLQGVIANPPPSGKWPALKEAILREYSASQNERYEKVLRNLVLGDRRPSNLFDQIQQNAPDLPDNLKRKLWLEKLPENLRIQLLAHKLEMPALVLLADDLFQNLQHFGLVTATPHIFTINESNFERQSRPRIRSNRIDSRSSSPSTERNLKRDFEELKAFVVSALANVKNDNHRDNHQRGRTRSRGRFNSRNNSPANRAPSRFRNYIGDSGDQQDSLCYYHKNFGQDAIKCYKPCSWNESAVKTVSKND